MNNNATTSYLILKIHLTFSVDVGQLKRVRLESTHITSFILKEFEFDMSSETQFLTINCNRFKISFIQSELNNVVPVLTVSC